MNEYVHLMTIAKNSGSEIRVDLDLRDAENPVLALGEYVGGKPTGRDIVLPVGKLQLLGCAVAKAQYILVERPATASETGRPVPEAGGEQDFAANQAHHAASNPEGGFDHGEIR